MEQEDLDALSNVLQEVARDTHGQRVPFSTVKAGHHHQVLSRAIKNVLGTELSIFTYAQIIDGLPTADVAWDRRLPGIFGDHIIDDVHEDLCPGAMDKAREFYENWDPSILMFDPKVVEGYNHAEPGSKPFNLRLTELVVVSLHQVGVALFQLDLRLHRGDIESVINWAEPDYAADIPPRPTLFNHPAYLDYDIYPEGLADVVGYWAEDRIIGGVTVFDHRPQVDHLNPPNLYLHPCRRHVTDRVCQLLDEQQQSLFDFLLSEDPSSACPLPILINKQNRVRFDWMTAHTHDQIFRDVWERKPLEREDLYFMLRRPQGEGDYPEIGDMIEHVNAQLGIPLHPRPRSPSESPSPGIGK